MPPRFSVVIPVYNRASKALPTLQSVRAQAFRDFECIVVDDGSTDGNNLKAVVQSLDDPRFRYVRRENGGASAARNTGIDEATGEFIAFLDSDDRWLPHKLEQDSEASGPECILFSPMFVERNGRIFGLRPHRGPKAGEAIGDYLTRGQGFIPSSTITVPAALASDVHYDETLGFGDDTDFAIRLAATGASFRFIARPQAIMNDDESCDRLSRSLEWRRVLKWLQEIRPNIGDRAFLAYRGWHVARMAADDGHYATALHYFGVAFARGALPPALAVKALGQILLRRSLWKRVKRRYERNAAYSP